MISHFDDLLRAARAETLPQRLLIVFAGAELPADATADQRAAFDAEHGGALVPIMCVDKRPVDVESFAQLSAEADTIQQGWKVVLAGALTGSNGGEPTDSAIDEVFQRWLAHIQSGRVDQVLAQTIAFSRTGEAISLMN